MTQDSTAERRRHLMAVMDDKKGTKAMTAPEIERQERLQVTAADGTTHRFYTKAELQASIAVAMMGAVVKPLEWRLSTTTYERCEAYEALCAVGVYAIAQDEDSPTQVNVEYGVGPDTFHKGQPLLLNVVFSFEAAKAAAQADYQARILSALSTPTDATAALEAHTAQVRGYVLEEAAQFFDSMPEVVFAQLAASAMRSMKGVK